MVPFEYFRKLEEECLGYYRHFTEMNLKEKFDSFVPDRILYEKKWKCKFPPFLGSYDRFFYPFAKIRRPKRIKLLQTRPEHCEYWKYLYSGEELKYVLKGCDDFEYSTCHVLVPEGFVSIDLQDEGRCTSFYLIFNNGKRYLHIYNGLKLTGKDTPSTIIPCFKIEEYLLDEKGFNQFSFAGYSYYHERFDYNSKGIPLSSYEDSFYVSHEKFVSNILEQNMFSDDIKEVKGMRESLIKMYQENLKHGYQEV